MDFIIRYIGKKKNFLVFFILFILSFMNFSNSNKRQNSINNSLVKDISNNYHSVENNIVNFSNLKEYNNFLIEENSKLLADNIYYKNIITENSSNKKPDFYKYSLIPSKIIKNTNNGNFNKFIINKGFNDGININMGVINSKGVVGIIDEVYDNYSIGLSLYNKNIFINSKLKSNNYFGSLKYEGEYKKHLSMENIPSYISLKKNDTIFTTGYSFIFPEKIPIGLLKESHIEENSTFYYINVEPFVDFTDLNYVYIINSHLFSKYKHIL